MKKAMLISALGLLVTACGGPTTPTSVNSVSGTVVELVPPSASATEYNLTTKAWTGGAGTVNGQFSSDTAKIKLGDLAANGAFQATLPQPAASDLAIGGDIAVGTGCTGRYVVSDPAASLALMDVSVDVSGSAKDGGIAPLTMMVKNTTNSAGNGVFSLSAQAGLLMYTDRAVTVTGKATCPTTTSDFTYSQSVSYDLNLTKGWNFVTFKDEGSITYANGAVTAAQETLSMKSGQLPSDQWVWNGLSALPLSAGKGLNVATTPAALFRKASGLLR